MSSESADKLNDASAASATDNTAADAKLPPLSAHDFRLFNHTAEQMNYFVSLFPPFISPGPLNLDDKPTRANATP